MGFVFFSRYLGVFWRYILVVFLEGFQGKHRENEGNTKNNIFKGLSLLLLFNTGFPISHFCALFICSGVHMIPNCGREAMVPAEVRDIEFHERREKIGNPRNTYAQLRTGNQRTTKLCSTANTRYFLICFLES